MPEPDLAEPEFGRIALRLVDNIRVVTDDDDIPVALDFIIEQLRQVWNARGAADLAVVKAPVEQALQSIHAEWGEGSASELDVSLTALKALDR